MTPAELPFLPPYASPAAPALYDAAAGWLTYGALAARLQAAQAALAMPRKALVFCLMRNSAASAAAYLAAAQSGHAVAALDPALPHLPDLVAAYRPAFIIAAPETAVPAPYRRADWPEADMALWHDAGAPLPPLHPDLFLLLLTSGSTGGGKFVRPSYRNLASNTASIIASLNLTQTDRALLHLPLSYSFGLSVLHSHLACGGSAALTELGMMERGFWDFARTAEANLFPGVPYHYAMLARLGLARLDAPRLTRFIQAGGRLDPALAAKFAPEIAARGGAFHIMYGQTEAAPRMTCFPAHAQPQHIGSVGQALPGGRLEIVDGEVVYHGPNVMLGYCTTPADLALGDVMQGRLATGDRGLLDAAGYLTLTGRAQRFAKLYGVRLALDEIELVASRLAPAAVVEGKERIIIFTADPAAQGEIKTALQQQTALQPGWFTVRVIPAMPYRSNGKLDYPALQKLAESP